MPAPINIKESFEVDSKHGAFYTGGNVEWLEETLYCQCGSQISLLDIESGTVKLTIGEEEIEDADTIYTFTTNLTSVITAHKSGLLKIWTTAGELQKMWRSIHKGPIARLNLKENNEKLATGGSDGSIRIWDMVHHACVQNLVGCQGVINVVEYQPKENVIFGSGDDAKIISWNLYNGNLVSVFEGHFSKVTSITFHYDGEHMVSSSRDKVLILWNIAKSESLKILPVYEAIESVICLPIKFKLPGFKSESGIYVASAGENGKIRVWDMQNSKEIYSQTDSLISKASEEGGLSITKLLFNKSKKCFAVVTVEHKILLYGLKKFDCQKQFVGFSDEILDVTFVGKNDSHLAVATNSADIVLYEYSTMNSQLLRGHTDIVLNVSKSAMNPNLLVSCGKDNTIRVWLLNFEENSAQCVGIGRGHSGSVGSAMLSQASLSFVTSVSQDTCIKIWDLPKTFQENEPLKCIHTEIAHQKDINCVTVSPNDKIIATGSQDKTAKLWTDTLQLIGVLKGHKRGIWSLKFSPVDQIIITSSADCTVKMWSISDLTCLKTLEGHESSVLRLEFLSNGMQILTAGADGLLKLFSVKTSECTLTLDQHEGRIWALAVKTDESVLVSGGADSLLIKWKDVTEQKREEKIKEQEELALQEQQLSNYVHSKNYLKALRLALNLERPFKVLRIVQAIIQKGGSGLQETVAELRNEHKEALLKCSCNWNTNSKNCQAAQLVLNILLDELQTGKFRPVGLRSILEGALPYTERHYKRLTQLNQDLHFITYTINCMQPFAKVNGSLSSR